MHAHLCCECGESFECHAPLVVAETSTPVCILVYEEGADEQMCDDCTDQSVDSDGPGVIVRIH